MGNRILKESIRTSKSVNAMTDFQFRCWTYLLTYVDDYGRGSADAEILKGFVFPRLKRLRESDIEATLAELAGIGAIRLYEVDGEPFFCFPNWGNHQRIQTKKSKFPEPLTETDSSPRLPTVGHRESPPESNPNQSESETESESKSESESESKTRAAKESASGVDGRFLEFWQAYPKKVGKAAVSKLYSKLRPSKELHERMLAAIAEQKQSEQWQKQGGQFIPNPATWLNQGRWEDEIKASVAQQKYQYPENGDKDGDSL